MTEPTVSSMQAYASMDVNSVRIHSPTTATMADNNAATKLYVNQAAAVVRDGIVGEGVSGALDTLKEIEVFWTGEPNMSAGLVNQLSSVQSRGVA